MNIEFDKPFKTSLEQLEILEERGLSIINQTSEIHLLERIGYYTLINGYSKPFMYVDENGEEKYVKDTTMNDIYMQYTIDYELHNLLFPIMTEIENHLKTVLGIVVSKYYGINDKDENEPGYLKDADISYLDISNYQYSLKSKKALRNIKKHSRETRANPTAYYRDKKNHIPPWILFRNIYLWHANSFYRMLHPSHKIEVCLEFISNINEDNKEISMKVFADSFEVLREFRNCIAHGNRLYAFNSKSRHSFKGIEKLWGPGIVFKDEYKLGVGINDFYGLLLSVLILQPTTSEKNNFVNKLEHLINVFNTEAQNTYKIFIKEANLPINFIERLRKAANFK